MIYNVALFVYLLVLAPKLLWERFYGKKHPAFLQRLGFFLPISPEKKVIWIHAVSVGEVKASVPFFLLLKEKFPDAWFLVTTTTEAGYFEAKRVLLADCFLFLPIDFSWVAKRFVKKLKPDIFFLIEGDIWPNLIKEVKQRGGKSILVSGKMSERSFLRLKKFPFLAHILFSNLDLICVQSEEYFKRFFIFAPIKVRLTGNLKFDMSQENDNLPLENYLTISCTHRGEEEMLLDQVISGPWRIYLAPRHPERFDEVASLLRKKNVPFTRFGENIDAKVILVDSMGKLGYCYAKSQLAIVGGSFVPEIGGHNLLEPALYGCPTIFGPHTEKQEEITDHVLKAKAGLQTPADLLFDSVNEILRNRKEYSRRSIELMKDLRGATQKTWDEIEQIL